jgi:hypothetical protein
MTVWRQKQPDTRAPRERLAYTAVIHEGGYRLGIAEENVAGYTPVADDSDLGGTYPSLDEAQAVADACNDSLGLDKVEAMKIVLSSMGAQRG